MRWLGPAAREEGLHLEHVLRKVLGRFRRAAQRAQGELIGARRAAEAKVDAVRKQPRQRAELLGDDVGRMVRQHDAAGADPDGAGSRRDMPDHDRRRGAGDPRHVVVLRHPDPAIAQRLGMAGDIARIVQRAARVGVLGDADEIKDGEGGHGGSGTLRTGGRWYLAVSR